MSWGKSYIILASVLFLLFSFIKEGALAQEFSYAHATVITPKGVSIPVEVSDTPEKRSLGLGNTIAASETNADAAPTCF